MAHPWISMWVRPRETIRAIVKKNPRQSFYLLSAIYGFPLLLQMAQNFSLGEVLSFLPILLGALILSLFIGMLVITVISGLLSWTGGWIGGKASFLQVRAAVAWANVPNTVNILMWLLMVATFGNQVFTHSFAETPFIGYQLIVVFFAFLVQVMVAVWGFIIGLKALGEVQGFSAWKALLNVLIPFFMVMIGIWILMWLCWIVMGVITR